MTFFAHGFSISGCGRDPGGKVVVYRTPRSLLDLVWWELNEQRVSCLAVVVFDRLHDNAALSVMRDALALADAANRWDALATETVALAGGAAA